MTEPTNEKEPTNEDKCVFLLANVSFWDRKSDYLTLMRKYINCELKPTQFVNEFCYLRYSVLERKYTAHEFRNSLKNISETDFPKLSQFLSLMEEIFMDCDCFQPDPKQRYSSSYLSRAQLRENVTKALKEVQDYSS